MNTLESCDVCDLPAQQHYPISPEAFGVTCDRCGKYSYDCSSRRESIERYKINLSGYVREQNISGIIPTIDNDLLTLISRRPMPRIHERAMRLLLELIDDCPSPSSAFYFSASPKQEAILYLATPDDVNILLDRLHDLNLIRYVGLRTTLGQPCQLTAAGYIAAEDRQFRGLASPHGFVAMSFAEEMTDSYVKGFSQGIYLAGYSPIRIDQKEHANSISDEILSEIRRARFVVADYTHQNNGVYFEAGFAVGIGIPVIGTCRSDHFNKIHFDIRHINTIQWHTPQELSIMLARRISAVLGDGPMLSNT